MDALKSNTTLGIVLGADGMQERTRIRVAQSLAWAATCGPTCLAGTSLVQATMSFPEPQVLVVSTAAL
jgi:hypothetical protein